MITPQLWKKVRIQCRNSAQDLRLLQEENKVVLSEEIRSKLQTADAIDDM
jgi:hypothetical protein